MASCHRTGLNAWNQYTAKTKELEGKNVAGISRREPECFRNKIVLGVSDFVREAKDINVGYFELSHDYIYSKLGFVSAKISRNQPTYSTAST